MIIPVPQPEENLTVYLPSKSKSLDKDEVICLKRCEIQLCEPEKALDDMLKTIV